jgi:hypothetical protein
MKAEEISWIFTGRKPRSGTSRTLILCMFSACALSASEIEIVPQVANFLGTATTGVVRPVASYTVGAATWQTTNNALQFDSASYLQAQGLENPFLQALSNQLGAGWSYAFNTTAVIADNTFQVHTYDAQAPPPPASNNDALTAIGVCPAANCVGTQFFFNFVPTGDDPTTNIHWVQILYDNYLIGGGAARVTPFYEIDNAGGTVPYYDVPFVADSTGFKDTPFATGPASPTVFDALDLLVSGPAPNTPGQFTIYGGIEWGFSNQQTPEPSSVGGMVLGLAFLYGFRKSRSSRA